jgi:membrane protein DedA with SNARE-associated domain
MLVLASISESLVNETAHFVREAGLPGVFALMALSSACIPIPSEVVMLFAGFAVADPTQSGSSHHMTLTGVILAGLIGSMVGSWVAYAVGRGGRLELLERHATRFRLLHPEQVARADRFFKRYGELTVLFGRLVPLVRAFVSLPAGIARMPLGRFTVFSLIGTIPWVVALALAGHALGGDWKSVRNGFEYVDYAIVALLVVGVAYSGARRRSRRRSTPTAPAAPVEAPPIPAEASPTRAKAPPTPAEAPPIPAEASPTRAKAPPTPAEAPPIPAEAPPTPAEASPTPAEASPTPAEASPTPGKPVPDDVEPAADVS